MAYIKTAKCWLQVLEKSDVIFFCVRIPTTC